MCVCVSLLSPIKKKEKLGVKQGKETKKKETRAKLDIGQEGWMDECMVFASFFVQVCREKQGREDVIHQKTNREAEANR